MFGLFGTTGLECTVQPRGPGETRHRRAHCCSTRQLAGHSDRGNGDC